MVYVAINGYFLNFYTFENSIIIIIIPISKLEKKIICRFCIIFVTTISTGDLSILFFIVYWIHTSTDSDVTISVLEPRAVYVERTQLAQSTFI